MKYVNHPTINDKENRDIFFNEFYKNKRKYISKIPYYHYNLCADINHQVFKRIYYYMRGSQTNNPVEAAKIVKKRLEKYKHFGNMYGETFYEADWNKYHPLMGQKFNDDPENIDWDKIHDMVRHCRDVPKK